MGDTLTEGQKLEKGGSLDIHQWRIHVDSAGRRKISCWPRVATRCGRRAPTGRTWCVAEVQTDGNFVLYTSDKPVWHTDTKGAKDVKLVLQDDRNVVLYAADGPALVVEDGKPPIRRRLRPRLRRPKVAPAAEEAPGTRSLAGGPNRPRRRPPPPPPAARSADIHGGLRRHPVGDLGTLLR